MMHGYSGSQVLQGIQSCLEETLISCKTYILDSSSLTDPSIAHADVILVDPNLSVSIVAGIAGSINSQRFIKLVQSTISKNKTMCMPWNVSGKGWSAIVMKQDDNGTPHVFYQDSLGRSMPSSDEKLKESLISSHDLDSDSDKEINIFDFLNDKLFNTVPKIHDMEIEQQLDILNTGAATILNSVQIISSLSNGVDKSIVIGLTNKIKNPNFMEKLKSYIDKATLNKR